MAFGVSKNSITLAELKKKVSEAELVSYYIGVKRVPCIISSPLRVDKNPSFGLYSKDGIRIYWVDFATKERGSTYDLLCKLWHCSFKEMLIRVDNDIQKIKTSEGIKVNNHKSSEVFAISVKSSTELKCKVREWRQYDIDYWLSYGVSLEWLRYSEVYPISHIIWIKEGNTYTLSADKYAYAYVEHKEGRVTLKIYQPFNKKHKWLNKHDRSVISLWAKIPEYGDKLVICSSLKDALCLWSNTGIPAIAVQGEGYGISDTALRELRRRYKQIYILFDNDEAGLQDGVKLSKQTGFTNVVLPSFKGGKDVSDLYKVRGKKDFLLTINTIINCL